MSLDLFGCNRSRCLLGTLLGNIQYNRLSDQVHNILICPLDKLGDLHPRNLALIHQRLTAVVKNAQPESVRFALNKS
ncbi:hypothetical protein WS58_06315 [Burkholderia pseudomultivorans]|nr:hypothetical protein WS56_19840 [Burkholderia pseudomultivorans]KVC34579.1 hypothetical protein WS55_33405 [Burkholderia pseudomultivorans]KVC49879.1 hypothetical protein WS58_06315 [Burkholderia pseudomultivorans]